MYNLPQWYYSSYISLKCFLLYTPRNVSLCLIKHQCSYSTYYHLHVVYEKSLHTSSHCFVYMLGTIPGHCGLRYWRCSFSHRESFILHSLNVSFRSLHRNTLRLPQGIRIVSHKLCMISHQMICAEFRHTNYK